MERLIKFCEPTQSACSIVPARRHIRPMATSVALSKLIVQGDPGASIILRKLTSFDGPSSNHGHNGERG
jgi:hypothetical protein